MYQEERDENLGFALPALGPVISGITGIFGGLFGGHSQAYKDWHAAWNAVRAQIQAADPRSPEYDALVTRLENGTTGPRSSGGNGADPVEIGVLRAKAVAAKLAGPAPGASTPSLYNPFQAGPSGASGAPGLLSSGSGLMPLLVIGAVTVGAVLLTRCGRR